ncbi:MAG: capsule assembly Wzi family protein [Thermodesulfovibrionales bacterium]
MSGRSTFISKELMHRLIFIFAQVLIITLTIVPSSSASTYLSLDDETYEILNRLEAEGVIEGGLLSTKPLNRKEIKRLIIEAERNSKDKGLFIQNLIKYLKERFIYEKGDVKFIRPVDNLYVSYIHSSSHNQTLNYNKEGDSYNKGSNLRAGLSSRAELGWLSFYLNPEIRYSGPDTDLIMKRSYGVLSLLGLDLQFGRDSQWWGPGYHGALLVSNNAEPLTMLRFTNSYPVLLPSVFKYLGPFRFVFFITRLEEERTIPEPYLWGMRFNFKPHPYIEIGLERTALLGGRGRSSDLKTWLKSLTGRQENDPGEPGDQRAGFDLKITLPFKRQPLQLYVEAAEEDEAGGLPYKWAYLAGIYMPRILSLERLSLRAEYANTHVSGGPNVWYSHHIYGLDAYSYKGRIIGHHIGTDSRDGFFELSYFIPERDRRISIFYDREEHNLSGSFGEKKDEFGLRFESKITKGLRAGILYQYGDIKNIGNLMHNEMKLNQITGMVTYEF